MLDERPGPHRGRGGRRGRCRAAAGGRGPAAAARLFDEIWYGGRPAGPESDAAPARPGRAGPGRPSAAGRGQPPVSTGGRATRRRSSTDPTAGELWRAARARSPCCWSCCSAGWCSPWPAAATAAPGSTRASPAPSGARAVAELLRDQGVTVDLVTTTAAMVRDHPARRHPAGRRPRPAGRQPGRGGARERRRPGAGHRRPPRTATCRASRPSRPLPACAPAGCALPAARRAGAADPGWLGYDVAEADLAGPRLCYSRDGVPSLVQGRVDGRPVTLLGASAPLTNERLDDEGNAALALGLLGAHPRLVWYLPSAADVPASDAEVVLRPGPRRRRLGAGAARRRGAAAGAVAGPPARAPWSSSRCRSSCGPPRRSRAGPGSTGAAAPAARPPRRCAPASGTGSAPPSACPRRAEPPAVVAAVAARSGRPGPEVARAAVRCRTCRRRRAGAARRRPRRPRERGPPTVTEYPTGAGPTRDARPRGAARAAGRGRQGRRRPGRRRHRPGHRAALPRPRPARGRARAWRRPCWSAPSRPRCRWTPSGCSSPPT